MGRSGLFDLERHFAFYGAYHSNPFNILIHTFLVWPLFFTSVLLFHFTPSVYSFPSGFSEHGLEMNFGFVFTVMYALYYVGLDKKAGSLAALLCFVNWVGASLLSWAGQIIGHGVFEKRAPSENFAEGLLMGPYFVLLELLHFAFGYEPYPGFYKSVNAKIDADISEWKVAKNQKKLS
ncbi:putative endoplasmic reticulum membrane protein [Prunus yedoensis var. nudiflora]|uniref:Putative endoplasmic reticulum membrane protein n=1 Tax=Prunus yedoensis var. nudiflora TaxID=2094558 RepID=A0A314Y3D6_PRUYE|nr:putative endoplasmic reticulum membrane protein [Prunus yedoensis var. nudiflora]